jgi:hypothetical protein
LLPSSHSLLEALVCIYLQRLLLSCFPSDQHRLIGVLGPSQDLDSTGKAAFVKAAFVKDGAARRRPTSQGQKGGVTAGKEGSSRWGGSGQEGVRPGGGSWQGDDRQGVVAFSKVEFVKEGSSRWGDARRGGAADSKAGRQAARTRLSRRGDRQQRRAAVGKDAFIEVGRQSARRGHKAGRRSARQRCCSSRRGQQCGWCSASRGHKAGRRSARQRSARQRSYSSRQEAFGNDAFVKAAFVRAGGSCQGRDRQGKATLARRRSSGPRGIVKAALLSSRQHRCLQGGGRGL